MRGLGRRNCPRSDAEALVADVPGGEVTDASELAVPVTVIGIDGTVAASDPHSKLTI